MAQDPEIVLTLADSVRTIRINRPRTKNSLDGAAYRAITAALNRDAADDSVVATLITGTGDYYSSGFDIKDAMSHQSPEEGLSLIRDFVAAFINYPKLLIALVNGHAIGIAVTTAALCDVVYACEGATFGTPFVKIGLCAEGASSHTFPSILGRSKASEMLLMGKTLTAGEAYNFGFVSEVVPRAKWGEFCSDLKKLGKELSVNSVKITKKLVTDHSREFLLQCSEKELRQLKECMVSEEFGQGIVRFMSRKSKL